MRALLFILTLIFPCITSAKTIVVKKGSQASSVEAALVMALPYDTILVFPEIYTTTTIIINKPIYLMGLDHPVVDGKNTLEMIQVFSSHVTIKGFRVIRSGYSGFKDLAALKVAGVSHVNVLNNIFEDNYFAVYFQQVNESVIANNSISSNAISESSSGNGIHCWKSDKLLINNNKISGHRDGIYFEFVTNSRISGNESFANLRYGLHFMFSHDDEYMNNIFRKNGAGVAVMFTRGVTMKNNIFEENWGDASYGLLLKEISDSHIEGNRFIRNTMAVFMEGTSRVRIVQNQFSKNGWALKIQASCTDSEITLNNFQGNSFDVGTNGTLVLNTFNGNYWDKYEGYDLNRNGIGDVPFRPVTMFSMIVEKNPTSMVLFRSLLVRMLDKAEKVLPGFSPEKLKDETPRMKPVKL